MRIELLMVGKIVLQLNQRSAETPLASMKVSWKRAGYANSCLGAAEGSHLRGNRLTSKKRKVSIPLRDFLLHM